MAQLARESIVIETDYREKDWYEREQESLAKAQEDVRKRAKGEFVGEILRWGRADGHAQYMVIKQRPLTLAHIQIGDGYAVEYELIRGLRLADVKERVEADREWKGMQKAHEKASEKFYEDNLGKIVHYHDGFGQFIRCEVVRAPEDVNNFHNIKKGELCMKETALVGKWRSYDLHSDGFHAKGRLFRPNLSNVYEFSKDLQKREDDPRKMEPCMIIVEQTDKQQEFVELRKRAKHKLEAALSDEEIEALGISIMDL